MGTENSARQASQRRATSRGGVHQERHPSRNGERVLLRSTEGIVKRTKHGDFEETVKFLCWSDFKVHIIFSNDLAESRIARYDTAGVAADSSTEALFTRGAGGYGHLFFKHDACARVIAHECWHAIWWMMMWAGVKDWDNETMAYHLGYLVGRASEFQAKVLSQIQRSKR